MINAVHCRPHDCGNAPLYVWQRLLLLLLLLLMLLRLYMLAVPSVVWCVM
jgi:hypothetical protein